MHIRDISERRRVALVVFDISELSGLPVQNVTLSNYGHSGGTILVYGIIEEQDDYIDEATITWNTAPGVQNDPTPPAADPVALDYADLTELLLRFEPPEQGVRESTDSNQPLDDFINSDTDGIVAFIFAPAQEGDSSILRTKELEEGGTYLEGVFDPPPEALKPNPADGQTDVTRDVVLNWRPGRHADTHNVYFGTDFNDVNEANLADTRGVLFSQNQEELTYDPPGVLNLEQTYYWRIDEVNDAESNSPWKGHVWSFTVADFILVDDFESYNDYDVTEEGSNRIYLTWLDGYGISTNGSTAGYAEPDFYAGDHYLEDEIFHGGLWSMPLFYDNSPGISEVTRTLTSSLRDWTDEDVVALSMWYQGVSENAAEPMYVAINGSAVVTNDDPNAALATEWTEWAIDMQRFADQGVNLANVETISIGFGNKSNPIAGGSGHVFFDDIRLYRCGCFPNIVKPDYDLNNDCVVNQEDLDLLMEEHGRSEVTPEEVADVYREAESADSISAPMGIYDDATASGGQYITVEAGTGSSSEPPVTGVAEFNITVDAGVYRIFAKTIAPDGVSDSFWFRIQGATTQIALNDDDWANWRVMPQSTGWVWVNVVSHDAGDALLELEMNAGNYTVEIAYREEGAQLDCFMLIGDPDFQMSDLDPLQYDLNGDGTVDDADVDLLMSQWLEEILWP
jgi:hypothetical protein